jgi:hypothetical protein
LRRLWIGAAAEGRGLLRVLLLRLGTLPSKAGRPIVLRTAGRPMSGEGGGTAGCTDWAGGTRGCLIWGIPAAILLITPEIGESYLFVVWPVLLTFMGAACLLNARRCGRIHCFVTGPFFQSATATIFVQKIKIVPQCSIFIFSRCSWWALWRST